MIDRIPSKCEACHQDTPALPQDKVQVYLKQLHNDWKLSDDGTQISRRFTFKGFAKAVYLANMAAFLADQSDHHPDITFGYGYCDIRLTTHAINGLSINDFVSAKQIDNATSDKDYTSD